MIKVKVSYPEKDESLLKKTLPVGGFSNIQYTINPASDDTFYDYWIVFNFLPNYESQQTYCPKENTIFVAIEPIDVKIYPKAFLSQFAIILTFNNSIVKNFSDSILCPPLSEWFVKKTIDELREQCFVEKTKLISIISSDKTDLPGQRKRLKFVYDIKAEFKDKIDLFGRGICPFDDKWDVLKPYKYSIAIENSFSNDYFTEKINDCFLSHTFPIYYGCPNLEKYFNSDSFDRIDINDFKKSIEVIERLLEEPEHYVRHLPSILKSKELVLNDYNLFAFCQKLIIKRESENHLRSPEFVKIKQKMRYTSDYVLEMLNYKFNKYKYMS